MEMPQVFQTMVPPLQSKPPVVYVSFSAEIIPPTAEALLGLCAEIANEGIPEIYLMLSTPGGSVMSGITIYNTLRSLPVKLTTHNMGSVDSIGNVVFLAGETRYACPGSSFMFHGVGFDLSGHGRLEGKQLRERLDALQADERKIGAIVAGRTKLSEDQVSSSFLEGVTRDPVFAKEHGIVDEIRELRIPAGAPVRQFMFKR